MDFTLKIFVYLDSTLPTPEAISLIHQAWSHSAACAGIVPAITPASLHRVCITFTFSAETTAQADDKADKFIQSLMEHTRTITDGIREGSNVLSFA